MLVAVLDHLWQSTLFLAGAGLLTLILRDNSAHIRFWLWFAASVKFLFPFAALTALGAYLLVPVAPQLSAPALLIMQPAAQPFSAPSPVMAIPVASEPNFVLFLLLLWGTGSVVTVARWFMRWSRLRRVLREAVELPMAAPLPIKMAPSSLEPGLVGIWKPFILLPQGIAERLSSAEMAAIIAHEICHFRRRDNLLAAIHMLVEALFWFYPLVWWLGARLNAERERACDENVLAYGNAPQVYAESILKVCKLYLQSPLGCVSGVSGADLKKRMETIVENKFAIRLNGLKKVLLATSAALAVITPLALGLVASPLSLAQAVAQSTPSSDAVASRRAEQSMPRKAISLDPKAFDKFVGYYQLTPDILFNVHRDGAHFFARVTGQVDVEWFPESSTKFFATVVPAQISFNTDAKGNVTQLVLHQNGAEQPAKRIDEATAKSIEAALTQRIAANKPGPGTEQAIRHQIDAMEKGAADYSVMSDALAAAARAQAPVAQEYIKQWGGLKSITFKAVGPGGMDIYDVAFEHQATEWRIAPPGPDGKIKWLGFRPLP